MKRGVPGPGAEPTAVPVPPAEPPRSRGKAPLAPPVLHSRAGKGPPIELFEALELQREAEWSEEVATDDEGLVQVRRRPTAQAPRYGRNRFRGLPRQQAVERSGAKGASSSGGWNTGPDTAEERALRSAVAVARSKSAAKAKPRAKGGPYVFLFRS